MTNKELNITPIHSEIWSGRVDSETDISQFRLHQVVKQNLEINQLKEDHVALIGFASDEGVRRNKGRVGAVEGPEYFRKSIGSLCYHRENAEFYDLGDIVVNDQNLEVAQGHLAMAVQELLKKNRRPFVIGGGHETAFGHFVGLLNHVQENEPNFKLGILNIDAHLDVRSYEDGAHSGSWALQAFHLADKMNAPLGYLAYGLNTDNNTKFLLDKARSFGADWCTNQEVINAENQQLQKVQSFVDKHTHIYCTVCLDVFDSTTAPGVSAPAWNGIQLQAALNVIEVLKKSKKLISMDVCELNPSFDIGGQTARAAGSLFSHYLK